MLRRAVTNVEPSGCDASLMVVSAAPGGDQLASESDIVTTEETSEVSVRRR